MMLFIGENVALVVIANKFESIDYCRLPPQKICVQTMFMVTPPPRPPPTLRQLGEDRDKSGDPGNDKGKGVGDKHSKRKGQKNRTR